MSPLDDAAYIMCSTYKNNFSARSFHVSWSRKFQKCNPPSQIFMKFDMLVELLFLIPNIPIFSKSAK